MQTLVFLALFAIFGLFYPPMAVAQETRQIGFGSSWSILSTGEKEQFIAGYLKGLNDASQVTDLAITYVKENPSNAVAGLESLRKVWDVSKLTPKELVERIDTFYGSMENRSKPLSLAVSWAKIR